jgi:nucleotide-binding universal stress UspA family protein
VKPVRSILVATDFSADAGHAVDIAIDLARQYGAEIHIVHGLDVPTPVMNPYSVTIPDTLLSQAREEAARRLGEVEDKVKAAGVTAKSHLTEVPAAPALARVAEEVGSDLIVMGTRGLTGLKHVLLGSVAERTLRLAPCSVLIVKDVG